MIESGVYVIECPNGSVYVGESKDLDNRQSVRWARLFGLKVTLIRSMPGSTKRERLKAELEIANEYRMNGTVVISLTMDDVVKRARFGHTFTHEELSAAGKKGAEVQKKRYSHKQRSEWAKQTSTTHKKPLTQEQRDACRERMRRIGLTGVGRQTQLRGTHAINDRPSN